MSPTRTCGVIERLTGTPRPKALTQSKAAARIAAFPLTGDPGKPRRALLSHRIMSGHFFEERRYSQNSVISINSVELCKEGLRRRLIGVTN
jgi:hypothetical protein